MSTVLTKVWLDAAGVSPTDVIERVEKFADAHPAMPIGPALELVAAEMLEESEAKQSVLESFQHMTYAEIGAWAMNQPHIMQYLPHKKINAIKELRGLTALGLKESKHAVEYVCYALLGAPHDGWGVGTYYQPEEWHNLKVGYTPNYQPKHV